MALTTDPNRLFRSTVAYLDQATTWRPKTGAPVAVADMDVTWRFNSAAFLLRSAARLGDTYSWGTFLMFGAADDGDLERWDREINDNPARWMTTTALFRALVAGLPHRRAALAEVAESARHFSGCTARFGGDCSCSRGPGALAGPEIVEAIRVTAKTIHREAKTERKRLAREARIEARRREDLAWMAAHPGIDRSTNRPYGVDEDGVNHLESHGSNDNCRYDSCSACGGYHCGPCFEGIGG